MLQQRVDAIKQQIAAYCERAGRTASTIRLIAVSKTFDADRIRQAYSHGLRDFGENYADELVSKQEQLNEAKEWLAGLSETISQADLVSHWESMPASEREQIDCNSTWIDGGFDRIVKEIRDGAPGVTVIRREDRDRVIQGESMLVEVTIPMNQRGGDISDWPRFQGAVIVDDTQLNYSDVLGGKWI